MPYSLVRNKRGEHRVLLYDGSTIMRHVQGESVVGGATYSWVVIDGRRHYVRRSWATPENRGTYLVTYEECTKEEASADR